MCFRTVWSRYAAGVDVMLGVQARRDPLKWGGCRVTLFLAMTGFWGGAVINE